MSAALHPVAGVAPAAAVPAVPTVAVPLAEILAVAREYVEASRFDAADRILGHVLRAVPRHAEALHLSGFIAFKKNRLELAAEKMEQALAAGAQAPRQLCNLAEVYRVLGRIDEGLAAIRRAAVASPSDPVCHFNEAMLRYEKMDTEECVRASRRAIALKPDMPEAHMRLGQTLLLTGAFEEGWAEYEWRYQIAGAQPLMPPAFLEQRGRRPHWEGAPLPAGHRLLLVADQGFGDVLMFARYIPWACARAADVTIAISAELQAMLERLFPGPIYTSRWDSIEDYAVYCPFSGLPRLAGTRLPDVPAPVPYIQADPARIPTWRAWLHEQCPRGQRRVGIAWAGRPTHNNDRNRTITLDMLAPLAQVPGISLVSLQKGPAAAQLAGWKGAAPIANPDALLETFEDTAALIASLDLVVAVDTSINHLAGAMGRPAWVMVPFAPDWRWMVSRRDTPWYPTLRLYRQEQPRYWAEVVRTIALDLGEWAASGGQPSR